MPIVTTTGSVLDAGFGNFLQLPSGLSIPKKYLHESSNRGMQVSQYGGTIQSLEQFYQMQIMQSRTAYFVYGKVYETHVWTRACIDYIARRGTREPSRLVDAYDPDNPDIKDLRDWLDACNEDSDWEDLDYGVFQDLLKYQAAYQFIEPNRGGNPHALWPLDARITFPVTDHHGTIQFFVQSFNGSVEFFDKDEIIYYRMPNNGSDPRPLPSIRTLLDSVAMALNANRFNAALFENNLNIGAVFTLGPNSTDEEVQDNDRYLKEKYSRPENAHRHLILRGDAKMLRDGAQALKDLQFEELIRMDRHQTCAIFGVPEFLIGVPENTNRSSGSIHELNTYVNTVRPLRRLVNRQFTRQFIRKTWGSSSIKLEEPLSAMLHTKEEIDAASEVANMGILWNEWREMVGMPRLPNGDYPVMKIPGAGGLVRIDETAMPGVGDPHFDPVAHELEHLRQQEYQQKQTAAYAKVGMTPPPAPVENYVPPLPQYQINLDPVSGRIIDVSRSMLSDGSSEPYEWVLARSMREDADFLDDIVSRRVPTVPGQRGGAFYHTNSGKVRYGRPPQGRPGPRGASPDGANNNLQNPKDPPLPKRLTEDERQKVFAARTQVQTALRQVQADNLTNQDFMDILDKEGWEQPAEAPSPFSDVSDARAQARMLAEQYPQRSFVVLGADGQYFLMAKDLSEVDTQQTSIPGGGAPGPMSAGQKQSRREARAAGEGGSVKRSLDDLLLRMTPPPSPAPRPTPQPLSLLLQSFNSKVSRVQE